MSTDAKPSNVRALYLQAVRIEEEAERQDFLNEACGSEVELRQRVEGLLVARAAEGDNLLQRATSDSISGRSSFSWDGDDIGKTIDSHPEAMGDDQTRDSFVRGPIDISTHPMIDNYRLLEELGHGGMGTVYMAAQSKPVKRQVALKVIKPGMDSKEVIARFEAERQALAMMDHPHIARVLDGGTTDEGRPYFVMELVRGVPITEFCKQKSLPLRERLELFVDICHAVQHAHQKGIIHRDLKPSNIMVTLHDGKPVVKVIDFGVAKALHQELTERTLFTHFSQMVGTPLYMAPEQAEMSGLGVDTRSDIYSLGVVLYELLTGTTPFDHDTMSKLGIDGIRKLIQEQEPPRPSARISTLKAANRSTIEDRRQLDIEDIGKQLNREVDWIVMKAIEKDRDRRYETANAFAADIQRFLNDEPVEACPPSISYRITKAFRRNRFILVPGCLIILSLITGISIALAKAQEAYNEKVQALAAQERASESAEVAIEGLTTMVQAFVNQRWIPQLRGEQRSLVVKSLRLYDRLIALDPEQADIYVLRGQTYFALGQSRAAIDDLKKAIELDPKSAEPHYRLANKYKTNQDHEYRDKEKAWEHIQRAVELAPNDHDILLEHAFLQASFDRAASESNFRKLAKRFPSSSVLFSYWCNAHIDGADVTKTKRLVKLAKHSIELDSTNAEAFRQLGRLHRKLDNETQAIEALERAKLLAPSHHYVYRDLGRALIHYQRFDEAIPELQRGWFLAPKYWIYPKDIARCHLELGNYSEATPFLREAIEINSEDWSTMRVAELYRNASPSERNAYLDLFDELLDPENPSEIGLAAKITAMMSLDGDTQEAQNAFQELLDRQNSGDAYLQYQHALICLVNEDLEAYRERCQAMWDAFADSNDVEDLSWLYWTLSLSSGNEKELHVEATELAVHLLEQPEGDTSLNRHIASFLMRAGQYDEAAERLEKVIGAGEIRKTSPSYILYFLAMTQQALGDTRDAQTHLRKANEVAESELSGSPAWNRRLTLQLLRKEAESQIKLPNNDPNVEDPNIESSH